MEAAMIASAVISVSSGIGQAMQQRQAAQDMKKARRAETAMQVEQNRRAAVSTLREARIRRAAIMASSENAGTRGASGESGAVGSIGSMAGSALGFQRMQSQNATNISRFAQRAADSQSKADTFAAVGNLADKAFSFSSSSIFNSTKPTV